MGGFCGGGSQPETGKANSTTSGKKDINKTTTVTASPKPKPKPAEKSNFQKTVEKEVADFGQDVSMGVITFGKSEAEGNAALSAAGYDQEVIQDYRDRTAANIEQQKKDEAQAAAMREQGRSSEDQKKQIQYVPAPGSMMSQKTKTEVDIPVVPGSPEDTSGIGSAEEKVVEDAKKKTGYAGTVETSPQGLLTQAKTTKKKSLMGGLIS